MQAPQQLLHVTTQQTKSPSLLLTLSSNHPSQDNVKVLAPFIKHILLNIGFKFQQKKISTHNQPILVIFDFFSINTYCIIIVFNTSFLHFIWIVPAISFQQNGADHSNRRRNYLKSCNKIKQSLTQQMKQNQQSEMQSKYWLTEFQWHNLDNSGVRYLFRGRHGSVVKAAVQ